MSPVRDLVRLQEIDQEWDEKASRFRAVREELADERALGERLCAERKRREQLAAARSALRDIELELDGLRHKARETEDALYEGRVLNPREVENLRQSSELLKEHISQLEDKALELMVSIEELEIQWKASSAELEAFQRDYAGQREERSKEYEALRVRLQELRAEREALRARLPANELALYEQLRARKGGLALAPVRGGICQACRVSVPLNKVRAVEQGEEIVICDGCGRILCLG